MDEEQRTTRDRIGALRIDAVASGFMAVLALAVSTYNVYLQRAQIRAQVWPHLEWSYGEADGFHFDLENTGVGPAIIRAVRVTVDGKPFTQWSDAFDAIAAADPELRKARESATGTWYSTIAERVIGAGVKVTPLHLIGVESKEAHAALRHAYDKIDVEICYCSTLGDCWMLPGSKAVAKCPATGFDFSQ